MGQTAVIGEELDGTAVFALIMLHLSGLTLGEYNEGPFPSTLQETMAKTYAEWLPVRKK